MAAVHHTGGGCGEFSFARLMQRKMLYKLNPEMTCFLLCLSSLLQICGNSRRFMRHSEAIFDKSLWHKSSPGLYRSRRKVVIMSYTNQSINIIVFGIIADISGRTIMLSDVWTMLVFRLSLWEHPRKYTWHNLHSLLTHMHTRSLFYFHFIVCACVCVCVYD